MANKGPSYGMSRDVLSRIEKKYDDELEARLVQWIKLQAGSDVGEPPEQGRYGFQQWLKNGLVSPESHWSYGSYFFCSVQSLPKLGTR